MAAHSVSTVDPQDKASFSELDTAWWDRRGAMYPLHQLNPVRLAFIAEHVRRHYGRQVDTAEIDQAIKNYYTRLTAAEKSGISYSDSTAMAQWPLGLPADRPLSGFTALDVGCGGGILAEPLAYLGAKVTGIDSVGEGLPVARAHARALGLDVEYLHTTVEDLVETGRQFDVVAVMEVVEHVANVPEFIQACGQLVKPGGFFILSTPNRNILSYLAVIVAAERILGWIPVGMHRWVQFLKPEELEQHLRRAELVPTMRKGFVFDPLRWRWFITGCDWIDYIVVCQRSGSWLEG